MNQEKDTNKLMDEDQSIDDNHHISADSEANFILNNKIEIKKY